MKKIILFIIVFSFFGLTLVINNGFALEDDEIPIYTDINFKMIESSTTEGYFQNASSIDVSLPSSSWNIKDVEINFTNIEFSTETKVIEENPTNNVEISKHNDGFGVQIEIKDPIFLQGVEIYGKNESIENKPIYLKIYGYDNNTNAPNNVLYGSPILLSMPFSTSASWHLQLFSLPIPLLQGNYYLTIDGSLIELSPHSTYFWYLNDVNPLYPELYSSTYDSGSWSEGIQGEPFLYKIIQKVNASIFPESINMTAQIDGNSYSVLNGKSQGKGYLKKVDVNYSPNKNKVNIEVKNNKTSYLLFNASYNFRINNTLKISGELKSKLNEVNEWILTPEIIEISNNYTVEFFYPSSWFNLQVFKNQQNITSDILIDSINKHILIHDEIIENNSFWEIKAKSSNINFNLNTPRTDFISGQELEFSIGTPILPGNYTFKLFNPLGREIFNLTKELPEKNNVFSYLIPLNAIEGDYIAYILWNNKTDAGIQSQTFQITIPIVKNGSLDLSLFLIIGLILTGGLVVGGTSYYTIKKVESKKQDKIRLILEKCTEIMSLKHIIVLDNKSGIDVYSQSFEDEELEPTLISGFLQAIHNFGTEVLEKSKDTRTVKVEYKKSFILMTEFVNLRLIIIMGKNPSKNFLYSMESLAYYIYKYYGESFDKFDGVLKPFEGISKLVEKILNVSFISPLKIVLNKNIKLSQTEKDMIQKASNFMREHDFDHFYSLYLLPDNACSPKDYETILGLIEKGIFNPVELDDN
ncbi:MAG: hypothetical protein ACFE9N_03345 [Promethearchaeota archaeon]